MFDGHVYGETPLYIYDFMGKFLNKGDLFIDLGCGRGEGLLYLCKYYSLEGLGIDLVEPFIKKGNRVVKKMKLNCHFKHENLLKIKLTKADSYYIAGTCMEDEVVFHLVKELMRVKAPLIFNLSFPLEDYGLKGYTTDEVTILMPFGKTELYIHRLN